MKFLVLTVLSVTVISCGGSLSDEQRKKLHDGMEDQKIVKLSDSEIVTASLELGRQIFAEMEKRNFERQKMDSIERQFKVEIKLLKPGASNALEVENQLIEAYISGAESGAVHDNIQKMHGTATPEQYDSLLYTRPKVSPLPDGAVKVEGIWNIYFAKKEVVRAITKE
jgi:hypothetical protein